METQSPSPMDTAQTNSSRTSTDLLTLAREPDLSRLLSALFEAGTLEEKPGPLPSRANQIARMIVAEAIRLVRLGTQTELADAGVQLVRALTGSDAATLAAGFPEADRLLNGATVAVRGATSPDSSGGALTVLRGWNGKALRALEMLEREPGGEISRSELRERLGVEESYLSKLLGAMEAAGLVVRIREGRTTAVHVGPAARSSEVRVFIDGIDADGDMKRAVVRLFQAILDERPLAEIAEIADVDPYPKGLAALRNQLDEVKSGLAIENSEIADVNCDGDEVVVRIRLRGTPRIGRYDGGRTEHPLVWVGWLKDGTISEVESWTDLDGIQRPATRDREQLPREHEVYGLPILGENESEPAGSIISTDHAYMLNRTEILDATYSVDLGSIERDALWDAQDTNSDTSSVRARTGPPRR
jgi:DNA-binding transcriptional ArsR family regulator